MNIRPYALLQLNLLVVAALCAFTIGIRIVQVAEYSSWTVVLLIICANLVCVVRSWEWLKEKSYAIDASTFARKASPQDPPTTP